MGGRRNPYGYHEYRGRSRNGGGARAVLLFIIALLAVLLAAGAAFYLLVDIEYTDTGIKINWPWAQESEGPPPIASDPLEVITTPEITVEPTLEVEPDPTATPEPELKYLHIGAVTVTAAQLRGGGAAQAVAEGGGNALVVEMKDVNGRLAWQSQAELAAALGANAADDLTAQAVRELAQNSQLYLVAKVQCFRDPLLARNWVGTLMTKGGNLWHDAQGLGWSSPANQQAADYLSALCLELADMGFDEILLERAGYPNFGEVHVLATGANRPEDLTAPVSAFLKRISGELAERGVCLSVSTDETLLPGNPVNSGLTADVLAQHAGRVWLSGSAGAQQYVSLLTAAGMEDLDTRLVAKNASSGCWYS